nr:ABC transporter ATP-binding protein/permease [Butyrivibrio sp.]
SGAINVNSGRLTQGEVVALYNYMTQILVELVKLANLILNITRSIACGNRIQDMLEVKSSMINGEKAFGELSDGTAIEFKNVSMRYPGASDDSLRDISFNVEKGQSIGVIGGTGSGKSSLINLIPRFYDTFSGEVILNGRNIKEYDTESLREHIGMVPQRAVLFHGTIRDNMKWGKEDVSDEEIYEALEIAQAVDVVDGKEGKLSFLISQGGRNLSGGQKQRLTIARALVRKPQILILDDSASALDFATDRKLRSAIKDMKNAPTTFIVSQRTSSIRFCDKIIVLDDGKLVGQGTHDELIKNCEVYKEIYESQYGGNSAAGKEAVNE